MKTFLFGLTLLVLFVGAGCKPSTDTSREWYVVVLSLDGFRWDYPDLTDTPTLDSIARAGVRAEGFIPVFPTKTFPNHYSMATGLYPDHHGIVGNTFFDPESSLIFRIGDSITRNQPGFYGGEPVWITASKAGLITATFFWVGSEIPIHGQHPTYWKKYDHSISFGQRIDTVIYWLNLPKEVRPKLIMCYLDEPDMTGHQSGSTAPETMKMVQYLDSLIGVLCRKINQLPHAHLVNLLIVSDHGMTDISEDQSLFLDELIPPHWTDVIAGENPNFTIRARKGYLDSIQETLASVPQIKVWRNPHLPQALRYGKNPRTLDLTLVAIPGWSLYKTRTTHRSYLKATHGYEPSFRDMHAIFYASGPAFKKNHIHPPFENVNLYFLITHLLNIPPAPNDGNFDSFREMLVLP